MNKELISVRKLAGKEIFDQLGDRLGRVRDFVIIQRSDLPPLITGIVALIPGHRLVFLAITHVTSITQNEVIATGKLNLSKFKQRSGEDLVLEELKGSAIKVDNRKGIIEDLFLQHNKHGDWELIELDCKLASSDSGIFSQKVITRTRWDQVELASENVNNPTKKLATELSNLLPADSATEILNLPNAQQIEVVEEFTEDHLADVLEEMAEKDQAKIISRLDEAKAARVLEAMQPDDAADLIAELPEDFGSHLLGLMEPEEAEDVRTLMSYDQNTAGGLMTNEPIILSAGSTVAEGLARIRDQKIAPALASLVCICLPPLVTPSGRFLGVVTFQRMLRYPPSEQLGNLIEQSIEPVDVEASAAEVSRVLASYDLIAVPVINKQNRLVGVVTVDDVLDRLLPANWRKQKRSTERSPLSQSLKTVSQNSTSRQNNPSKGAN